MNQKVSVQAKPPKSEVSEKSTKALRECIKAELLEMLEGEIDIPKLQEITRFAHTAQELLMVRSPIAQVRRKKKWGNNPGYDSPVGNGSSIISSSTSNPSYQAIYGYGAEDQDEPLTDEAAPQETWGTKMVSEFISAISSLKRKNDAESEESYADLVEAIKSAKEAGLNEVVGRLTKRLEGKIHFNSSSDGEAEGVKDVAVVEEGVTK